ncbi:MAG TPA: amidohydrolase [Longilinea sp.]|nr:amidohydrolase [Longilinea sp.]
MLSLYNGHITTLDPHNAEVTALAIEDGRITAIGSDEQLLSLVKPNSKTVNLHGKTVWPGLTDAHLHLSLLAQSLDMVDCDTSTREACLRRVAERARTVKSDTWIIGHGWDQNKWPEGFGNTELLDSVSNGHPVFLTSKSLHSAWVNSAALKVAQIDTRTPDPANGRIQRDENGRPTGILFEMSAMKLVRDRIPKPDAAALAGMIERAQSLLCSLGLTGVHDFDDAACYAALQGLESQGRLKFRVVKGILIDSLQDTIAAGLHTGSGSAMLRIGPLKLFADGALGPRTAAMLAPYENETTNTGLLTLTTDEVFATGVQAVQNSISLAIHAIGDRANRVVLDGYQRLREYEAQQHLPHLRHRIEHVQLLHPDDVSRLAALDLIASMQPIHATSDREMAEQYWGSRAKLAYAWRSLLDCGTILTFGSDAPVESPNPFWGMHAAMTRVRQCESLEKSWQPQQCLTLQEALHAYTIGATYSAGSETWLGRLSPRYAADLIVLSNDPSSIDKRDFYIIKPEATMVAGFWVWNTSDLQL